MSLFTVVDSSPFINQTADLHANNLVTIREVIAELKDKKTREIMQNHSISIKSVSEEALKEVIGFSKKTGDYASLSLTDLKVLALTLQLEWENVGREHIRREPLSLLNKNKPQTKPEIKQENTPNATPTKAKKKQRRRKKKTSTDSLEETNKETEEILEKVELLSMEEKEESEFAEPKVEPTITSNSGLSSKLPKFLGSSGAIDSAIPEDELSDSDQGEWITPESLKEQKFKDNYGAREHSKKSASSAKVACMSNDFAMQNVLLQMNLNLISAEGMRITKLKTWVLRCHACFKINTKLDRVFCESCGSNTLIRTSVGVDKNGEMKIYLKRNFQYNNRGTIYSIPETKGGRKNNDLILREDQKEYQRAIAQKNRMDKQIMNKEMTMDELISFARSGNLTANGMPVVGYGRKNINQVNSGRRRK